MSSTEMIPFQGLKIISKRKDELLIEHLLHADGEKFIRCKRCGGVRLEVNAIIDCKLIIAKKEVALVLERKDETISILSIIRCAVCGGDEFSTIYMVDDGTGGKLEAAVS